METTIEVTVGRSAFTALSVNLLEKIIAESLVQKESVFSASKMQEAIAAAVAVLQEADAADDVMERRGRKKMTQLLGGHKNSEVCSWFDKIRKKLGSLAKDLLRLMVCFLYGLADMALFNSYGKGASFYRMIKAHLQEKIPSMSMFQKAVKWFKGWRVEVLAWKNKRAEEEKHRLWERLCQKIKEELLRLEPQLAMAY